MVGEFMGDDFNPLVSVIIPVFKRTEWISSCLSALQQQTSDVSFEVIIVDDGSPNEAEICETVSQAMAASGLSCRFFRKENAGPASARNFAVSKSSGKILCFIDDDSIVDVNWLKELVPPLLTDSTISVVSGRICSHDRQASFPLLLEQFVYTGKHWATCNIAYRRELFLELEGFDPAFREASWEDNDLGLRARWHGAKQMHNVNAIVFHPHEHTLEEYRQKCLVNGRGAATFSRKYFTTRPFWSIVTPLIMGRNILQFFNPMTWFGFIPNKYYLKFLWSFYSLLGFMTALKGK